MIRLQLMNLAGNDHKSHWRKTRQAKANNKLKRQEKKGGKKKMEGNERTWEKIESNETEGGAKTTRGLKKSPHYSGRQTRETNAGRLRNFWRHMKGDKARCIQNSNTVFEPTSQGQQNWPSIFPSLLHLSMLPWSWNRAEQPWCQRLARMVQLFFKACDLLGVVHDLFICPSNLTLHSVIMCHLRTCFRPCSGLVDES